MPARSPLVVLGCGYTGLAAARLSLAEGRAVLATSRGAARAAELAALGIDARVCAELDAGRVEELVPPGAAVLITFPPDGHTDARIAPALRRAGAIVYLSSTGVYGAASGAIDEDTPVDPAAPRAAPRLAAEEAYRRVGAIVLRAAAIYGPDRGLHLRLARGEHRIAGDGHAVVSRIHVEDLARLALAALDRGERGALYNAADDAPVPQIEVIRWLCARLDLPLPGAVAPETLHETLRHDRAISSARIQAALGVRLRFPSYREGFGAIDLRPAGAPLASPRALR